MYLFTKDMWDSFYPEYIIIYRSTACNVDLWVNTGQMVMKDDIQFVFWFYVWHFVERFGQRGISLEHRTSGQRKSSWLCEKSSCLTYLVSILFIDPYCLLNLCVWDKELYSKVYDCEKCHVRPSLPNGFFVSLHCKNCMVLFISSISLILSWNTVWSM